jgi:hypothetical protein
VEGPVVLWLRWSEARDDHHLIVVVPLEVATKPSTVHTKYYGARRLSGGEHNLTTTTAAAAAAASSTTSTIQTGRWQAADK